MPLLAEQTARLPDLSQVRIACSMHLDIKMAPFVTGLLDRGAAVFVTSCNATTVRDDVVQHLAKRGADTHAWHNMPEEDRMAGPDLALEWNPTHFCEMGADLTSAYQQRSGKRPNVRAGLEATGSGISRLNQAGFDYPIYNWDDLPIKEGLHNRYMVGLTAWHTFFSTTQLSLHNKNVLVVGYGSVGRGVAESARAYGGTVTVAERDSSRAIEARFAGWPTTTLEEGLPHADVVVTATGARHVIGSDHLPLLRDGCFLLNVGHVAHELDIAAFYDHPHETVLPFVEEVTINNKSIFIIADGSMANLTAGKGDSLNAFDITLAVLTAGVGYMVTDGERNDPGLHILPKNVWQAVLH